MAMTHRNLWIMGLLLVLTLGLYLIYWLVVTKIEMNREGAKIPTAWLVIIPIANIYFLYKFAEAFSTTVLQDSSQHIAYFILFFFISPLAALICQDHINKSTIAAS